MQTTTFRSLLSRSIFGLAVALGSVVTARAQGLDLPVAYPLDAGRETRVTAKAAPSSSRDSASARMAAQMIAMQIKGGKVLTVMPTGSMRPLFDEKAYLVMEPVAYDQLEVGDIITYRHPTLNVPVVHRIKEKSGNKFWTKGDYNAKMDNVYVTPKNYGMRVAAIIYARDGNNAVAKGGSAHASEAVAMN